METSSSRTVSPQKDSDIKSAGNQTTPPENSSREHSDNMATLETNTIDPAASLKTSIHYDTSTSSTDLEKKGSEDPREHIFLGKPMSVAHELAFFLVVATANFTPLAGSLDSGFHQALCILRIIGKDLGVSEPGQLVWVMAGYGLTVGTFILLAGRLGDLYGHKRIFLIGNLWFAFFSLLAGLAVYLPLRTNGSSVPARYLLFLIARILQGIGPALLIPNAVALLGVTYVPGPRKAMLFAVFGAMAPASAIISPLFTSLLALAWWPYAFFALALVLLFVTAAGLYVIPDSTKTTTSSHHSAPPTTTGPDHRHPLLTRRGLRTLCTDLDIPGAATGVTGLALISVSMNQGSLTSWSHPYIPSLLALGLLLCAAFLRLERRAPKPLIPLAAINSGVALVLAAVFCGWACFGIWIYYVWAFYEELRGASPLLATAWHSPVLASGAAAALTFGFAVHRAGPAAVMAAALAAFTAGTALIATAPVAQSYWLQTFLCNLVITWGMDLSFPAATLMLSDLVRAEHQGIAASLVTTVVNYSGALALGIAGTVEFRVRRAEDGGPEGPEDVLRGYRGAWYVGLGFGAVGFVTSLVFVWKFSTRQRRGEAEGETGCR
ncbi:major facilitator superfamily transporter [Xylariaceae sp. FL0016]|nr:major facilitator superfamily transporter [Xylariaceae sp. FL0016]